MPRPKVLENGTVVLWWLGLGFRTPVVRGFRFLRYFGLGGGEKGVGLGGGGWERS